MKKFFAAALCCIMMVSAVSCISTPKKPGELTLANTEAENETAAPVSRDELAKTAIATANYSVNGAMVNYFYNYHFQYFLYQNYYYLSYYGLDVQKPLKSQACAFSDKENYTWHDYFMDQAKSTLQNILTLCEAAKRDGVELGDEDRTSVEDQIKQYEDAAADENITLEEYLSKNFGSNILKEDLTALFTMMQLSNKEYAAMTAKYSFTDEELEKFVKDNPADFYEAVCLGFTVSADYAKDAAEDVIAAARKKAHDAAEKIMTDGGTEETFLTAVNAYLTSVSKDAAKDSDITATIPYDVSNDEGKWLFSDERRAGDIFLFGDAEKDDSFTVYLVLTPSALAGSYRTVNVRHILVMTSSYSTDDAAKAKAEEILSTFLAGDKTAEAFGKLAGELTEDPGSKETGGLYQNVAKGEMVVNFNNWCFDSSRKEGDTGIVKSDSGYHVMYFDGFSEYLWKKNARDGLVSSAYQKELQAVADDFPITVTDSVIDLIGD